MKKITLLFILFSSIAFSQRLALLKYDGGGDWYANPTALPNLIKFCNANINTKIKKKPVTVTPSDTDLLSYPFAHMTGHGNVVFSEADRANLRNYLYGGGFLHIDDNYGMDQYIRTQIKKIFPNNELIELPASHTIFQKPFIFSEGLPKIHEHDNKRPQAFGIFVENRLILLYTYQCDLGDGWEDAEVHNDPLAVRENALKMGANIIYYVFSN